MRREGLVLLLLVPAACGAERWSFDTAASADADDAALVDADDATSFASDGPFFVDDSAAPEAQAGLEGGPAAEAAPPCTGAGDCPFEQPVCTRETGVCSRCTDDDDCAGAPGGPACDAPSGACVPCVSSQDCDQRSGLGHCYVARHTCVACLDESDCPRQSYCELASHSCTSF